MCRRERAVLAANMETALNAVWDAQPGPADRIAVVGAGVVGCLVAWLCGRIPGRTSDALSISIRRAREIAEALGVGFAAPAEAPARLRSRRPCQRLLRKACRRRSRLPATKRPILELSWYGAGEAPVSLGGPFHSRRLQADLEPGRPGRALAPAALDAPPPPRSGHFASVRSGARCADRARDRVSRICRSACRMCSKPEAGYCASVSITPE